MRIFLPLIFLFTLLPYISAAQSEEEQLAMEYFSRRDFKRASEIYASIYNKTGNVYVYDNYFISLLEINDFKSAVTLTGKQQKKFPEMARYRADEVVVYRKSEDNKALEKTFNEAVKWAGMSESRFLDLAKSFNIRSFFDLELRTLKAADKKMPGAINVLMELAKSYERNSESGMMIETYLRILDNPLVEVKSIEDLMQDAINADQKGEKRDFLRQKLLEKLQKDASDARYTDLLIWLYLQEGKYQSAFMQARAFDKRIKGNGEKVLEVGDIAASNAAWYEAMLAYEYIILKGPDAMLYEAAYEKQLWVQYSQIIANPDIKKDSVIYLARRINHFLKENGGNDASYFEIRRIQARINTYYLNQTDSARAILEKMLYSPRLSKIQAGQVKLDLADVSLISGDPYEAILLYGQVEKDFKNDTTGFYAKFKMGWTYYLLGEFDYAKALLEVLRGSTSKLIANDAMRLALFIQDNIDADSSYVPLQMFARSELELHEMHYHDALLTLDTILADNPSHPIRDDVVMQKAKIYLQLKDKTSAIAMLKEILATYYYDILADDALFLLANLYAQDPAEKENAMKYYLQLFTDFPESILAVEARKKYRQLRGDAIN